MLLLSIVILILFFYFNIKDNKTIFQFYVLFFFIIINLNKKIGIIISKKNDLHTYKNNAFLYNYIHKYRLIKHLNIMCYNNGIYLAFSLKSFSSKMKEKKWKGIFKLKYHYIFKYLLSYKIKDAILIIDSEDLKNLSHNLIDFYVNTSKFVSSILDKTIILRIAINNNSQSNLSGPFFDELFFNDYCKLNQIQMSKASSHQYPVFLDLYDHWSDHIISALFFYINKSTSEEQNFKYLEFIMLLNHLRSFIIHLFELHLRINIDSIVFLPDDKNNDSYPSSIIKSASIKYKLSELFGYEIMFNKVSNNIYVIQSKLLKNRYIFNYSTIIPFIIFSALSVNPILKVSEVLSTIQSTYYLKENTSNSLQDDYAKLNQLLAIKEQYVSNYTYFISLPGIYLKYNLEHLLQEKTKILFKIILDHQLYYILNENHNNAMNSYDYLKCIYMLNGEISIDEQWLTKYLLFLSNNTDYKTDEGSNNCLALIKIYLKNKDYSVIPETELYQLKRNVKELDPKYVYIHELEGFLTSFSLSKRIQDLSSIFAIYPNDNLMVFGYASASDKFNFVKSYNTQLPIITHRISYIIGKPPLNLVNQAILINSFIAKLQWYIYQNWNYSLSSLHLRKVSTIDSDINLLTEMKNQASAWNRLLSLYFVNTAISQASYPFEKADLITDTNIKKINNALIQVLTYLINLNQDSERVTKEFQDIRDILKNPTSSNPIVKLNNVADTVPDPFKSWLKDISSQTYSILLNDVARQIQKNWESEILPYYQQYLKNRFPFEKLASDNCALYNFNMFFAPQGILMNFLQSNFSPFINIKNSHWKLAQFNQITLPLQPHTLSFLNNAWLISNYLYDKNQASANISLHLKPYFLDTDSKEVNIIYNQQHYLYRHGNPMQFKVSWPVITGDTSITMTLVDFNQQIYHFTGEGDWALLKFISNGDIKLTKTPGHYLVKFNIEKHDVIFEIYSDNEKPIFDINLFSQFYLPQSLMDPK